MCKNYFSCKSYPLYKTAFVHTLPVPQHVYLNNSADVQLQKTFINSKPIHDYNPSIDHNLGKSGAYEKVKTQAKVTTYAKVTLVKNLPTPHFDLSQKKRLQRFGYFYSKEFLQKFKLYWLVFLKFNFLCKIYIKFKHS